MSPGPECAQRGHCAMCLAYVNCVTCCECGEALVPYRADIEWIMKDGQL